MGTLERRTRIADLVTHSGVVRVHELSELFHVSQVTIRTDLDAMHDQGLLIRNRGGAVANTPSSLYVEFAQRTNLHLAEKRQIGQAAARLVSHDETIALDAGTTVMELVRSLNSDVRATFVTNAVNVATQVGSLPGAHVVLLGGTLIRETLGTVGPEIDQGLSNLAVHKLFLSTYAFAVESGLSETSLDVANVKRMMAKIAHQVILLADSSKWGLVGSAQSIPLTSVHMIITDSKLPKGAQKTIRNLGIQLMLV